MARRFGPVLLRAFSALAALLSAHPAAAQPISADRVRAWFEAEFARAGEADLTSFLRGREFRYRVEWHTAAASSAEMEKWRSEIKGRPDHPSRQRLEEAERYFREGPLTQEITVWYHSRGRWRYSKSSEVEGWWEVAADDGTAWSWVERQLTVVGSQPPAGADYASTESAFLNDIKLLFYAGVNFGQHTGVRPDEVRVSGDRWTVLTTMGDGPDLAYEFEGWWDEAVGRGFVERVRTLASREHPEWVGNTVIFSDWQRDTGLEYPIAGRAEKRPANGRLEKVVVFVSAERFDMESFDQLVAVPSLDSSDPIRGPLQVRTIYDHRPNRQIKTALDPSGEARSIPLPGRAETRWVRYVGWAVLALLAAGLVGIRLLQSQRRA